MKHRNLIIMKSFLFITYLALELVISINGSTSCPPNQQYYKEDPCEQICDQEPRVCTAVRRISGCYCQPGYLRAYPCNSSECVPSSSCPGQCSNTEEYNSCNGCDQICNEEPIFCAQSCSFPGCYCKKGYRRASRGRSECIPESECPRKQCYPSLYEEYKCGCEQYCNEPIISCFRCTYGCYCKYGYKRSSRGGNCIPVKTCPGTCGNKEVYKKCGGCDQVCGKNPVFSAQTTVGPQDCRPGCYCKDGLVRANDTAGSPCITPEQCQVQQSGCRTNEVYECGCEQYCNQPQIFCFRCTDGCFCKKGYRRSRNGSCIRISMCKIQQCKGRHEEYKVCNGCEQYCNEKPNRCLSFICNPGCYCKEGYKRSVRGKKGICIPENSCPPQTCNKENEVYIACGGCDGYCNAGPIACAVCLPACYCIEGYVRKSPGGECVLRENCPKICKDNEEFNECGGCDQYCNKEPVSCTADCRRGCYCKKGYKRNSEGLCVETSKCEPQQCNGEFEEYKSCGGCDQYCNEGEIFCIQDCSRPGCYCKEGCRRSFRGGICIPVDICPWYKNYGPKPRPTLPQNKGPRAKDKGSSLAQNTGPRNQDVGLSETEETGDSFGDWSGFENSNSGQPIETYEIEETSESYSDWSEFESSHSASHYENIVTYEIEDTDDSYGDWSEFDNSNSGYDCRPDELSNTCGVGPECENYCGRGADACAYCKPACYCKNGTIRAGASNTTRCIPEDQCGNANKCFDNEEYSDCGTACPPNCENKNPVCTKNCARGCFCKEGYIRRHADTQMTRYECIPENQCP